MQLTDWPYCLWLVVGCHRNGTEAGGAGPSVQRVLRHPSRQDSKHPGHQGLCAGPLPACGSPARACEGAPLAAGPGRAPLPRHAGGTDHLPAHGTQLLTPTNYTHHHLCRRRVMHNKVLALKYSVTLYCRGVPVQQCETRAPG